MCTYRTAWSVLALIALGGCQFPPLDALTDASAGDASAGSLDGSALDGADVDAAPADAAPADATVDGVPVDAPVDAYVNALGRLCNGSTPCPSGFDCLMISGSNGFCSQACVTNMVCEAGYMGPAGGTPGCFVTTGQGGADHCGIACTSGTQCPAGLQCQSAGPAMFCLPP